MTLEARGSRRHRGSLGLVVAAGARAPLAAPEPGSGGEVSRQFIRVGKAMPKDTSQLASLRFCPGSQARTPELAWMDSESRGDGIWSASHVLSRGSMRWLRGTSSSWVVDGMVKSGRMCGGCGGAFGSQWMETRSWAAKTKPGVERGQGLQLP